ncbi:hypothetical protein D3C87_812800 [compost metagenome]
MATGKLNNSRSLDPVSRAMLYEGVTQGQMCILFRIDQRNLARKIHSCQPVGERSGTPIYDLAECAAYLVKPAYDIEAYIKRMHSNELPKHLSKEYWAGKRSQQEYELKAGDLWPTQRVLEKVGELFKLVRMSALLTVDNIERNNDLTDKQRSLMSSLMYAMLDELRKSIMKEFAGPDEKPVEMDLDTSMPEEPEEDDDEEEAEF